MHPLPISNSRTFSLLQIEKPTHILAATFLLPPSPNSWQPTPSLLSVSMDLPILNISCKSHNTQPFMSGLFHTAYCIQGSSRLWHVLVFHSFLWSNNILPHEYTTFCLFTHQAMGIWVVSTLAIQTWRNWGPESRNLDGTGFQTSPNIYLSPQHHSGRAQRTESKRPPYQWISITTAWEPEEPIIHFWFS